MSAKFVRTARNEYLRADMIDSFAQRVETKDGKSRYFWVALIDAVRHEMPHSFDPLQLDVTVIPGTGMVNIIYGDETGLNRDETSIIGWRIHADMPDFVDPIVLDSGIGGCANVMMLIKDGGKWQEVGEQAVDNPRFDTIADALEEAKKRFAIDGERNLTVVS